MLSLSSSPLTGHWEKGGGEGKRKKRKKEKEKRGERRRKRNKQRSGTGSTRGPFGLRGKVGIAGELWL